MMRGVGEPIAIVGVGLRFPGGNETLDGFSEFLREGRSGIRPLPRDRFDVDSFLSTDGESPGSITTAAGGFLERIDEFDAHFFNVSPKQAPYLDPQQRILLETAWQALEDANIDPTPLRHGNGGVYIGATPLDYAMELDSVPYQELDAALSTGFGAYALSGRLSYFLGWRGPSLTTDTACASSLTALHLAVEGLRGQECDIALCGAVNALHHPRIFAILSRGKMLAPDGRSKSFDEAADGYARAEGCGVLVLKRLADAQRAGDQVLAVVRATAIGQDGESAGLTAPNGTAQELLMRAALNRAGLAPGDVQYVEAHGTGTPLGDPIEMGSINEVFSPGRTPGDRLMVGSVKSNFGHMEPAAGLGGLVKVILQMRERTFFPHRYDHPSGRIPWDVYQVTVPTRATIWDAPVRRAMVNSFGVAGALGVAVLEEPPLPVAPTSEAEPARTSEAEPAPTIVGPPPDGAHLFTLSARSRPALLKQVDTYRKFVTAHPELPVGDACFTRNVGRAHFGHRVAGVVRTVDDVSALLEAAHSTLSSDTTAPAAPRKVAFLFTGSGSQYVGMGWELYRRFPRFRECADQCDALFAPHLGRSVLAVMSGSAPDAQQALADVTMTHAALFTLEYSLAQLWISWGVRPSVVIGHSVGELIAATVAGLVSVADGVAIVARRAELVRSVPDPGRMAAVAAPAAEVAPVVEQFTDLSIAAVNAPNQTVISGAEESLSRAVHQLQLAGLRVVPLNVTSPFHSSLLDPVAERLRPVFDSVTFQEPSITLVSNLTGAVAQPAELSDPGYWVRHLVEPVDFAGGMAALAARGTHVFVEIGPGATLTAMARRCATDPRNRWIRSLDPNDGTCATTLRALGDLYLAGLRVRWCDVHEGEQRRRISLPGYAFDRRRYWLPVQVDRHGLRRLGPGRRPRGDDWSESQPDAAQHPYPLLGSLVGEGTGTVDYRCTVSARQPHYLADHTVGGRPFFPAMGYVEMLLELADARLGHTRVTIRDLCLHEALFLSDQPVDLLTRATTVDGGAIDVDIASVGSGRRQHVTATLVVEPAFTAVGGPVPTPGTGPVPGPPQALTEAGEELAAVLSGSWAGDQTLDAASIYERYAVAGLDYGAQFRRGDRLVTDGRRIAVVDINGDDVMPVEFMPPPVLDGATHGLAGLVGRGEKYIGVRIGMVRVFGKPRGRRLRGAVRLTPAPPGGDGAFELDALLVDGQRPLAEIGGMRFVHLTRPRPAVTAARRQPAAVAAAQQPLAATAQQPPTTAAPSETDVAGTIRVVVARALGIDDVDFIDPDVSFLALGLDSLVAVEVKSELEARLGIGLPTSVVFDHPTARELAAVLAEKLAGSGGGQ